jgi:2'-hydroxyisoflavone reductase
LNPAAHVPVLREGGPRFCLIADGGTSRDSYPALVVTPTMPASSSRVMSFKMRLVENPHLTGMARRRIQKLLSCPWPSAATVTARLLLARREQVQVQGWEVMRLLFIGGTSFVGRHAVELAVEDGHDVTVFHRGRTNPDLLAGHINHRMGDRDASDYASIDNRELWDAVIDVCAYVPRHVHELANVLGGRAAHYVQVSSVSAYDPARATADEDSRLHDDPVAGIEDVTKFYGPLKAACERAATARFGDVSIVRPAYVCGPYDPTDRFTYWVRRMADGGDVVVLDASAPMQIIDVRDLGAFLLRCAATATAGAFDAVAPFASTASTLTEITPPGVTARLVEIDAATLSAAGIQLPMMDDDPNDAIISSRPGTRARAAGLTTRTAAETAEATRRWDDQRGRPPLTKGPTREQEAALVRTRYV